MSSDIVLQSRRLATLVSHGDFCLVRKIATPDLVTAADELGRTVLMLVAENRDTPVDSEKCISYLLSLGADPEVTNEAGDTAAHIAVRLDHLRLLTLLPFGAKWLQNCQGATPLMEAAQRGSWRCAKHLMHLLRQRCHNNCRRFGNDERLRLLGLTNHENKSAADLAKLAGNSELAMDIERELRLSVDKQGFISGLTEREESHRAELCRLVKAGDDARLLRVATRENMDLPDDKGFTALLRAAENTELKDAAVWTRLLQLSDPTCATVWSDSCLHIAAGSGNTTAASALLNAGASVNCKGQFQFTPLLKAASEAPTETADAVGWVLLASGSDWSLTDRKGRTALDLARQCRRDKLANMLLSYEETEFLQEPLEPPPPFRESWTTVRLIGRGGFGEVHEVTTDRAVICAAKVLKLPVQLGEDLEAIDSKVNKAIENEKNICYMRHDNIVRFMYMTQPEPAKLVLFMELLSGRSLEQYINHVRLAEDIIRAFCIQICSALTYIHSREPPVIHRDINCSNIIVLADNSRIKLIDFGLSTKLEESVTHISASTAFPKGTLNFLAPELVAPAEQANPQYSKGSDIWAFGCSIYQMSSGTRPYARITNLLQLAQQLNNSGAPQLPDGCSEKLRDFYAFCTARDRRQRKCANELMNHEFFATK